MTYSEVMLNSMTADELIRGLENGTIESLNAKMVLRIIHTLQDTSDQEAAYDEGFEDGKIEGRDEAIKEAIGMLENL